MEKLLSIIVPTYNMENYLAKCLDSLMISDADLFKKLNVIVVNDGSKDRSSEIAHSYETKFPDVFVVIDKENGNYGSCINAGIPVASARYVKILDADDYFVTAEFEQYLIQLQNVDADLILNDKLFVNTEGKVAGKQKIPFPAAGYYSFGDIASNWVAIDMHKMAYRASLLRQMSYLQTEGISYSDVEWMIKPLVNVNTAYYSGTTVYCYLQGREGQTINKKVRMNSLHSLHVMLRSIGDYWRNYSGEAERKTFLLQYFIYSLINIYREHFFTSPFNDASFRSFDADMKERYPEIVDIIDNQPWVSFIPGLKLSKDWREKQMIKYSVERDLIKVYNYLAHLINSRNS